MGVLNRIRNMMKRKKRKGASPRPLKARNCSSAVLESALKGRAWVPLTRGEIHEELAIRKRRNISERRVHHA